MKEEDNDVLEFPEDPEVMEEDSLEEQTETEAEV